MHPSTIAEDAQRSMNHCAHLSACWKRRFFSHFLHRATGLACGQSDLSLRTAHGFW